MNSATTNAAADELGDVIYLVEQSGH